MKINPNYQHKLILFCGPSGSGKTTIVHHLLKKFPMMRFSVSATTRPKRENETDGIDYHFLSPEEFRTKIANNEFLEWEEVYKDRYYGSLKSEVDRILSEGNVALFDIDVVGGLNIRKNYGRQLLDVFVMPPSVDELHKRLVARATEDEESLRKRLDKAEEEMHAAFQFNHVIVNIDLQKAIQEAEEKVLAFLEEEFPEPDDIA
ncbi:MAG: guanylate kinase [Chitinophagales bacterium]|nr:guanylate kinase [Chitinophagales bacterium]